MLLTCNYRILAAQTIKKLLFAFALGGIMPIIRSIIEDI